MIYLVCIFGFSYWDPCYDLDLMIDSVSLDLLYLQTIEELDLGWIVADPQSKDILASHESKKEKREVCVIFMNFTNHLFPWLLYWN